MSRPTWRPLHLSGTDLGACPRPSSAPRGSRMTAVSWRTSTGEPEPPGSQELARPSHSTDNPMDRLILCLGRGLSATLLLAVGGSHLLLWFVGYGAIPRIGVSFLANAAVALFLAAAMVAVRARHVPLTAALGSLFIAGTLGALTLALTVGLFGFVDEITTPLVPTTLVLELAGVVVLTATAVVTTRIRRIR